MKIGIKGFGAVGQGLAETLLKKRNFLDQKGVEIKIVAVEDSKGSVANPKGLNIEEILRKKKNGTLTKEKWPATIEEVKYDLLVEATPTNIENGEPGLTNMIEAIKKGIHVITSNKGPLVFRYRDLLELAGKNDVKFLFESTVGAGMPLINLSNECLKGNEINSIKGVLNGTCNYILSRMAVEGLPYEQVLSDAQELGLAESDPSFDVEGIDTALKLVILANSVMDMDYSYQDVEVEGITEVTKESLRLASEENMSLKLVGSVQDSNLEVAPRMVPVDHPLNVSGVLNAATLETDLAGEITVMGRGAGPIETSSALLNDILSISG